MRVYNKKDFLKLKPGTFFCKGKPWFFDGFSIKGESLENDFFYTDLCMIGANSTNELFDNLPDSLQNGKSFFINQDVSKDGVFDDEDLFLVYEDKDLEFIESLIRIHQSK